MTGYVADIGYTYGYYSELNPVAARFALLASGFAAPRMDDACEPGFGQGVSINLHAAASTTRWWGNDFLPEQAAFAQGLASAAGSNANLAAESFEAFCHRTDLPDMDFIGLHGVWTWVSEESRAMLVDFARRKLKPGGVLYVSYNTQPGWANLMPLRELFMAYADSAAPGAGTHERIDAAMDFTAKLVAANPLFLQGNAQAQQQVRMLLGRDKHYLAHEYFNADWDPMSFMQVAKRLAPAQVSFACSAHFLEQVDALYMNTEQLAFVQSVADPVVRQSVRDFVLNANFRREYWVRDARRLSPQEQREALAEERVVLREPLEQVTFKLGNVRLNESIYRPIVEALSDMQPKTVGELAASLQARNVGFAELLQALVVLIGKRDVLPAQDESQAAPQTAASLNRHVMTLAQEGTDLQYLASPVTGGGIFVPRFDLLFLQAAAAGEKSIEGWARAAWQHLARREERLLKDGFAVVGEVESLELMKGYAREFADRRLQGYRALGI